MIGRVEWKEPFLRIEAACYIKGSPLSDLANGEGVLQEREVFGFVEKSDK